MSSHAALTLILIGVMLVPPAVVVLLWYVRGGGRQPERWSLQETMRARLAATVEDVERPAPEREEPPAPTVELPAVAGPPAPVAAPTVELPAVSAGAEAVEQADGDGEGQQVPEPSAGERARLMAMPRQQLYDLARERGIEGRSRMSREQLVEALLPAAAPSRPPRRRRRRRPAARR